MNRYNPDCNTMTISGDQIVNIINIPASIIIQSYNELLDTFNENNNKNKDLLSTNESFNATTSSTSSLSSWQDD